MDKVVTYRLAYRDLHVSLCDRCVESGDHDCGALGPVEYGLHAGTCEGREHERRRAPEVQP